MIEKVRVRLETVSPVFIGTDKNPFFSGLLRAGESGEWSCAIDFERLRKEAFASLGLARTFELARQISATYSSSREETKTIAQILQDQKFKIGADTNQLIKAKYYLGTKGEFVRNGIGKAYIPASSVKGAMRTAILFWLSSSMLDVVEHELLSLKDDLSHTRDESDKESIIKRASKKLVSKSLGSFTYRDIFSSISRAYPDSRDFLELFRIVVVTDSGELQPKSRRGAFLEEENRMFGNLVEYRRGIGGYIRGRDGKMYKFSVLDFESKTEELSLKQDVSFTVEDSPFGKIARKIRLEEPKKAEFYSLNPLVKRAVKIVSLEKDEPVIKQELGSFELFWGVAELQIGIDRTKFEALGYEPPFADVKGLIELVKKFYERLWQYEKSFAQRFYSRHPQLKRICEFYEQKPADLRIGFGSGIMATTILSLATDAYRRGLLDLITPHRRPQQPAPKSRKIAWTLEGPWAPLGWLKIDVL